MDEAPIVSEPPEEADAAVIWLHGLGADGHDFIPILPHLGTCVRTTRFVFPNAPQIPVSINQGFVMRAWYDIEERDGRLSSDEAGLRRARATVDELVEAQLALGIASERVLLAGFSQGGAVVQHAALRFSRPLAGLLALSTYLPYPETLAEERHPANRDLPVFLAHGTDDPMIPIARAETSRDHLLRMGYRVLWRQYPMGHAIAPREIADVARWLEDVLA